MFSDHRRITAVYPFAVLYMIPKKAEQKTLGRLKISSEQAIKYAPWSDIVCLGKNLFKPKEIEKALMQLIAVNNAPESFICPQFRLTYEKDRFANPPVLYRPIIDKEIMDEFNSIKDDEISVYFNDVNYEIWTNAKERRRKNWWMPIKDRFVERLRDSDLPGGSRTKYYYSNGGSCVSSPAFLENKTPYQVFVYFFDSELHAYSGSVSDNIRVDGWYSVFEPYLVHENNGLWSGKLSDFLKTTEAISKALANIPKYPIGYDIYGERPTYRLDGEVKLIHPDFGLISMKNETYDLYVTEDISYKIPKTLILSNDAANLLQKEKWDLHYS